MLKAKIVRLLLLVTAIVVVGCQTQSTTSSNSGSSGDVSSSGNPSPTSGTTGSASSSGSSGAETPAQQSASKSQGAGAQNEGDAAETSADGGPAAGDPGEDETLAEALEAFERARREGGADGTTAQETQHSPGTETDFPVLLPPAGGADSASQDGEQTATSETKGVDAGGKEGARTAAEKVAVLDRELEASYGQFEGMILRERGYVIDRENAKGADIDPGEESAGETSGTGDAVGGSGEELPTEPAVASGSGGRPEGGEAREGDYQPAMAATYPPPPDIPDGSDDDVVARQLREAAMKEPDPELREKLWEEYRKYKNK